MAEPPYGILRDLLNSGEIIPFLGAGASLCGRPIEAKWNEKTTSYLPSGKDLADLLAEDARLPSNDPHDRDDLAKVASYYLERSSRKRLLERLHGVFNRDCQVGEVHRFLADIPVPLLIVTTNYDDLIEQAFKAKGKPYHLVVHPTESKELAGSVLWWKPDAADYEAYPPAKLPLPPAKSSPLPPDKSPLPGIETTIIYKMHGSINRRDKAIG